MSEFIPNILEATNGAVIRALGIGGGGCNAIDYLKNDGVVGVDFIAANSDSQALAKNVAEIKIQLGKNTAKGLGVGGNPELGKKCAEENIEDIKRHIAGSDMLLLSAGMGGGTGTGAAPLIAQTAREMGALVTAIVTKPFKNEGSQKRQYAEKGIDELRKSVDSIIVVSNQKLIDTIDKSIPFKRANKMVNEVLINAAKGIVSIIQHAGEMNIDFADIRALLKGSGDTLIGVGAAKGENRAVHAAENALNSPLLDDISIEGAKGVLINITADEDLSVAEINTITQMIADATGVDPYLKYGIVYTPEKTDEIQVTVLATKFEKVPKKNVVINEERAAVPNSPAVNQPMQPIPPQAPQQPINQIPYNTNYNSRIERIGRFERPNRNSGNGPVRRPIAQPSNVAAFSNPQNSTISEDPALYYAQQPYNAQVQKSVPRGAELKETEEPAFVRRNPNLYKNYQPIDSQNDEETDENDNQTQERPSFLRRIMD